MVKVQINYYNGSSYTSLYPQIQGRNGVDGVVYVTGSYLGTGTYGSDNRSYINYYSDVLFLMVLSNGVTTDPLFYMKGPNGTFRYRVVYCNTKISQAIIWFNTSGGQLNWYVTSVDSDDVNLMGPILQQNFINNVYYTLHLEPLLYFQS